MNEGKKWANWDKEARRSRPKWGRKIAPAIALFLIVAALSESWLGAVINTLIIILHFCPFIFLAWTKRGMMGHQKKTAVEMLFLIPLCYLLAGGITYIAYEFRPLTPHGTWIIFSLALIFTSLLVAGAWERWLRHKTPKAPDYPS